MPASTKNKTIKHTPEPEIEYEPDVDQSPVMDYKTIAIAGIVLIIGLVIFALFSSYFFKSSKDIKSDAQSASQQKIIDDVAAMLSVPGDIPVIATVTNLDKLADQPFFAKAHEDDKLLYYQTTNKVVLYRPAEKRIIEIGTLSDTVDKIKTKK